MTLDELVADRGAGLRHLTVAMGFTDEQADHLYDLLVDEHKTAGGLMEGPPLELRSQEGERRAPPQPPGLPTPPGQAGTWPRRHMPVSASGPPNTPAVGLAGSADRRRSQLWEITRCLWWTVAAWRRAHRGPVPLGRPEWTEPERVNLQAQADKADGGSA